MPHRSLAPMRIFRRASAVVVAIVLSCTLCVFADPEPTKPAAPETAEQFARQVEAMIATGQLAELTPLIDYEAHHKRTMGPLPSDDAIRKKLFGRGASGLAIIERLVAERRAGGTIRLLRVLPPTDESPAVARLRVIDGTQAPVQYLDLLIHRREGDNAWRVLDLIDDASSEPISVQLRRRLLPGWVERYPEWRDKLDAADRASVKYARRVSLMINQADAGQYDAAVSMYSHLPEPIHADRDLMRLNAIWSLELGDAEKAKAGVRPYIEKFGDDVALHRALVRKGFEFDQWPAALDSVNRIDTLIGGDAYLDVLRGRIADEMNEPDKVAARYATAIAALPTLPEAYYPAIQHALKHAQHAAVTDLLIEAESRAGVEFGNLEKSTAFVDYVASPEYARWKAREKPAE